MRAPLLLLATMLLSGCMDEPDGTLRSDATDVPAEGQDDIIEEPSGPPPMFNLRWEDVETHDLRLEGPDDSESLSIDLRGRELPLLVVVVPYLDCPQAAIMANLGGPTVTISRSEGGYEHVMEWGYHDVAQCTGQQRSRHDSFSILTTHDCFATTWTVGVAGNGPGAGAEVHVQRPADPAEAQRLMEKERIEHGDPCAS